jgi:hypothetical protein
MISLGESGRPAVSIARRIEDRWRVFRWLPASVSHSSARRGLFLLINGSADSDGRPEEVSSGSRRRLDTQHEKTLSL